MPRKPHGTQRDAQDPLGPFSRCIACDTTLVPTSRPFGDLLQCPACGLHRMRHSPEPQVAGQRYEAFYDKEESTRFNPILERLTRFFRSFRVRDITRFNGKAGRLLDIGFGRPSDLQSFNEVGWEAEGTQIVRHVVAIAKRQGLKAHLGELRDLRLPSERFDTITLWHVLEHLREPGQDLREAHRLLRSKGALILEVPNIHGAVAQLFGSHWFELDLPNHLWQFTPASLDKLLSRAGFRVEKRVYFSAEQSVFSFIQSALNLLTRKHNLLFEALKKNTKKPPIWEYGIHLFLASLLFPIALMATLLFAITGDGDTLRIYAKKSE